MGSSSLLDIIGSIIIMGFLVLMLGRLYGTISEETFTTGSQLTVQQNLVNLVDIVENDFRLLGWCKNPAKIADPTKAVLSASQNSISFLSDLNQDGNLDTVSYTLGTTSSAATSPNPRDKLLYRKVNGQQSNYSLGVTQFDFLFMGALGDTLAFPITQPKLIYQMQLSVTLESPAAYDTMYAYAYWKQLRLTSRNLRNR